MTTTYVTALAKACALSGKAASAARSSWAGKINKKPVKSVSQQKLTKLIGRAYIFGHGVMALLWGLIHLPM